MRKKYLSALLFGALLVTSAGTFTSCKDYDDDINGLQEQIDEINAKAPAVTAEEMEKAVNSAISALETKLNSLIESKADAEALSNAIKELNAAIENKADAATVTDILKNIKAIQDKLNTINPEDYATKAELEEKIQAVQEQINSNDGDITELQEELKELTEQLNGINEKIQTNADNITALTNQLNGYKEVLDKLNDLKDAEAGTLSEYVNGLIDEKLASYMTEEELKSYIQDVVTADIMTQISSIYVTQEDYNAEIQGLESKFNDYVSKNDETYKKLIDDVKTLNDYKTNTLEALVDAVNGEEGLSAKVENILTVLGDITDLKDELSGYVTTSDLNGKIESYLEESVKTAGSQMNNIQSQLKELGIEIERINAMVQSVSFAPEYADGMVKFGALTIEDKNGFDVKIAENNSVEVSFRVSPAKAAKNISKYYNVAFEGFDVKPSRSGESLLVPQGDPKIDENTGIVTYTMTTSLAEGDYAVCMHLTAKADNADTENEVVDKNTDITSDYFIVNKKNIEITSISVQTDATETVINNNEEGDAIDYAPVVLLNESIKVDKTFGYDNADKFKIAYTVNNEKFQVSEDGVLTLQEYKKAENIGQKAKVTATVSIEGVEVNTAIPTSTEFQEVTVEQQAMVEYVIEEAIEWNKDVSFTVLDKNKLLEAGLTDAELSTYSVANDAANATGISLVRFDSSKDLKLRIEPTVPAGEYTAKATLTSGNKTITVSVKFTRSLDNIMLVTNDLFWSDKDVVTFTPIFKDGSGTNYDAPTSVSYSMELKDLITNYAEVETIVGSGNLVIEPVGTVTGVSMSSTEMTIDLATYVGGEIKISAYVKTTGGAKVEGTEKTATVVIPSVAGSWVAPTNKEFILSDRNKPYDVLAGCQWKDMRGKVMWDAGKAVVGTGSNGFGVITSPSGATALSMYSLSEPELSLEDKTYIEIKNNQIVFTDEGKQFQFVKDYTVKLTITANVGWGVIDNYEGNNVITLTIPAQE